jgi:hypothetical protein
MQLESLADLKHIPISFFTFKSIDQLPFEASNPIAIVKKGVRCELRRWEIGCGSCAKARGVSQYAYRCIKKTH